MSRVMENLAATLLPVHLGRQTETAGWEGLIEVLGGAITGYTSVAQARAQAEAAQAALEVERMRLAAEAVQTPGAKLSRFLGQYWPHLAIGTAGIVTLALIFRKPK